MRRGRRLTCPMIGLLQESSISLKTSLVVQDAYPSAVLDGTARLYLLTKRRSSPESPYIWMLMAQWRTLLHGSTVSSSAVGHILTILSALTSPHTHRLATTSLQSESTTHRSRQGGTPEQASTATPG